MTFDDERDPVLGAMARLPSVAPDERRASRVRARCHAALSVRRRHDERTIRARRWLRAAGPGLVGLFCVVYLATVIGQAIEFTFL
jgi:hypothetical protein